MTPATVDPKLHVELVYFTGCPHAEPMRERLHRCLERCGVEYFVTDVRTDEPTTDPRYRFLPSPSVLVNGVDVLGSVLTEECACRMRLPTEAELLHSIQKLREGRTCSVH